MIPSDKSGLTASSSPGYQLLARATQSQTHSKTIQKTEEVTGHPTSPFKTLGSKLKAIISRKKIPHHHCRHTGESLLDRIRSHTEAFRNLTMLAKTTVESILHLDRLADASYEGATLGNAGVTGFADVTHQLDMYASGSNLLASALSCFQKGVKVFRYNKIKRTLKKGDLTAKQRAVLEKKKRDLKSEVKSAPEWLQLGAGTLASVSYFAGSVIALAAPKATAAAAVFGSVGFGVLYAVSKGIELRQNYRQFKAIKQEIKGYQTELGKLNEGPGKEIAQLKIAALRQKTIGECKLNMLQNTVDMLVGVTAFAAGVATLAGGVAAIPLAAALAASLACKAGIAAYRNLRNPAARHRSKLSLQKKVLQVKIFFSRGAKRQKFREKLDEKRIEYTKALAAEKTSQAEASVLKKVDDFLGNDEDLELKTSIAEEMGCYGDDGNADPTQLTQEIVLKWLGV